MLSAVLVQARTVVLCWFNSVMKIGEKSLKKTQNFTVVLFLCKIWRCHCMAVWLYVHVLK